MAVLRSLLSFLSRLWTGHRHRSLERPLPAPPADSIGPEAAGELEGFAEPAPPSLTPTAPAALEIEPPSATPDEDRQLEEDEPWEADEDPEDELTPDPFIAEARPTPEELSMEALELRRSDALAAALIGEHKIPLSSLAGPGTLAEALNRLLQEGRVTAEFCDDGQEEPHLIYRQKPQRSEGSTS